MIDYERHKDVALLQCKHIQQEDLELPRLNSVAASAKIKKSSK